MDPSYRDMELTNTKKGMTRPLMEEAISRFCEADGLEYKSSMVVHMKNKELKRTFFRIKDYGRRDNDHGFCPDIFAVDHEACRKHFSPKS